ncbi:laccase-15-like isoform X4 [Quercus robur]|uniref:laccase-15-like isoform X4 n=1 Tax=Quercus robur TaxID=38942 RepID=UPI002163B789|nr:laccase-15-like isoform X4 [Quercus robur]
MWLNLKFLSWLVLIVVAIHCQAYVHHTFVVKETPYTRLCSTKNILTVNGQFPGPALHVHQGDTIFVDVHNQGNFNITIHWHGVKQPRDPWSDGLEYITQCPIQPGGRFRQKIIFSTEVGTLWWHAHSEWWQATVHGAIIIHPKKGTKYPFPHTHAEVPIIFGEWWKQEILAIYNEAIFTGGAPNVSDAYTINGQPGVLYPCSKPDTFKLKVDHGKTYLLRLINSAVMDILFFAIAKHNVTVVGTDGSYTKPLESSYVTISPSQTIDVLLKANQKSDHYYMAARAYSTAPGVAYDNTTTTAILEYNGNYTPSSPPSLPNNLPYFNNTNASVSFTSSLKSFADKNHPVSVPINITKCLSFVISVNTFPCPNNSCAGPNGTRLATSVNNISFVNPHINILQAYYGHVNGVFGTNFPDFPPYLFNFTTEDLPLYLETPRHGTKVKILKFNITVELVFQGTTLVGGNDHPMHLHGYSFYVVGMGLGNFDKDKDPLRYNLVDPPFMNTIAVPLDGWTAIRFRANNPGLSNY